MNSCREFEGKNVEKAVELACQTLNISKNQIKYDVISNGSSGIFSIIRNKKAKIRVSVETANRNRQKVSNLVDEAFGVKKQKVEKTDVPRKEKSTRPVQPKPRKESQSNQHNLSDENLDQPVVVKERVVSDFYKGKSPEDIGKEVIVLMLKYITDVFDVNIESDGESLIYHVSSEDSAVIIGKRGQNLEAIQYIVDKIVNKHSLERKRVLIDVEGYLEKRRENLEKMAIRMSEKVQETGKPSTISQMSSQDRRIVHLALKDNKNVRTQSMGEGYYRRLVIFPKKGRIRKKKS
ncbi:MAG: Jag N-terminal domain-containing protein [Proteobacteria bacterium]|nr:Jag N-terminal domain-containing protein [Pseudomonadota bacterium]